MNHLWTTPEERDAFFISVASRHFDSNVSIQELAKEYNRRPATINLYIKSGTTLLAKRFGIYENEKEYLKNGYTEADIEGISDMYDIHDTIVVAVFEANRIHRANPEKPGKASNNTNKKGNTKKLWKSGDERKVFLKNMAMRYITDTATIEGLAVQYGRRESKIQKFLYNGFHIILSECNFYAGMFEEYGNGYLTKKDVESMSNTSKYSTEIITKILSKLNIPAYSSTILPSMDWNKFTVIPSSTKSRSDGIMEYYRKILNSLNDGNIFDDKSRKMIPVIAVIFVSIGESYAVFKKKNSYIVGRVFTDSNGLAHVSNCARYECKFSKKDTKGWPSKKIISRAVFRYLNENFPIAIRRNAWYVTISIKDSEKK